MALTDQELLALLADFESDRVERKESAGDRDKLSQAICAFANDLPGHGKPGVLFVGVTDKGSSSGLRITDELLRTLADLRDQGTILPPPSMSVRKVTAPIGDVAVVEVQPSTAPPVRYKGRIYIRVGPRRGIANLDDERRLNERRRALDLPFDARPVSGATLDDLDLGMFEQTVLPALQPPDVLAENGRSREQQLIALRLLSIEGTPTVAGVLSTGRDPLYWLPGAYVQFLRIDGTDLTAPVRDEKRIDGTLLEVLRQLDEHAPVRFTWFVDRVEVINPGGPYGSVSVSNFGTPGITDYRSPTLADVMHGLGYVQRFGAGIPLIRDSLAKNSNAVPRFDATDTHVAVTMWRRS